MKAAFSVFRVKHTPLDPAHPKARPQEEKGVNNSRPARQPTIQTRSSVLLGRVAFLEEDP
jgi:hypothetical protein